jgi:hypothetical protein
MKAKKSQGHGGQAMSRPGGWAVSAEEALLNGWQERHQLRRKTCK